MLAQILENQAGPAAAARQHDRLNKVWESGCGAMFTPKGPYPTERTDIGSFG